MTSQFTPTSSTTVTPVPPLPQTFAMPSADANNYYDTLLTWTGGGPCYISFGAGAPVGPNVAGNVVVQSGQTLLLTTNAATLAASTPNQNLQTGPQAAAAPNATSFTVLVTAGGGSLTVTRGSSLPIVNF